MVYLVFLFCLNYRFLTRLTCWAISNVCPVLNTTVSHYSTVKDLLWFSYRKPLILHKGPLSKVMVKTNAFMPAPKACMSSLVRTCCLWNAKILPVIQLRPQGCPVNTIILFCTLLKYPHYAVLNIYSLRPQDTYHFKHTSLSELIFMC